MTEAFLHYIWKFRLFCKPLFTTEGEPLTILSPGIHNHHSGPDFSDARLRIGDTLWAGNVEIHILSSDWNRHGHHNDAAYDSIVLHAVYTDDAPLTGTRIPVVQLSGFMDPGLYNGYKRFVDSQLWVPCFNSLRDLPVPLLNLWLERMLIERLEQKAENIRGFLAAGNNDWEEAFYLTLARSFGFGVNALPFEMLARSLPYRIVARHLDNPFRVEALVFGQAGMLTHDLCDPWAQEMFSEYAFLRKKYHLVPIPIHTWRFLRLRPVNFPTIRLSQFAALLTRSPRLPGNLIERHAPGEIMAHFEDVRAAAYWDTRYTFDKPAPFREKYLGTDAVRLLMINAVLPFMFEYGRAFGNDELCSRTLDLYNSIPGERNACISSWEKGGMRVDTAFYTQSLLLMKTEYCDRKRCLDCRIGNYLLSGETTGTGSEQD
ncbi:MAG TPA: DUF2851 family protein [Lentimicrobium sp.]|nr:DUF2851 family protein [Lentimicrobium sp.]